MFQQRNQLVIELGLAARRRIQLAKPQLLCDHVLKGGYDIGSVQELFEHWDEGDLYSRAQSRRARCSESS